MEHRAFGSTGIRVSELCLGTMTFGRETERRTRVERDLHEQLAVQTKKGAESDDLFRLLVANVRDYAIFILNPGGHVTTWNIGAERIKGYVAGEIIGRHFSVFYPDEDIRSGKCEKELELATRDQMPRMKGCFGPGRPAVS